VRALFIAAIAVVAAVAVSTVPDGSSVTRANLRLDAVPFRPELAVTSEQRSLGLMNRRRAPADGMLFVFRRDTSGGFWMKNTLVPLTIVFFDAEGKRVRRLSMTPCRRDPCPIYEPRRRYRFALELPANDRRPALRLGPLAKLRQLSRTAD
jgi:uncharacterized membrane protein (UPF0127 family)